MHKKHSLHARNTYKNNCFYAVKIETIETVHSGAWPQHSHCVDTLFATNLNFKILFLKAIIEKVIFILSA
ncbi:unnamed protein product [Tenebrio molitor]|nr:unnamed protein product [Tenebrio molitor]